jgi:hypothetical protein
LQVNRNSDIERGIEKEKERKRKRERQRQRLEK